MSVKGQAGFTPKESLSANYNKTKELMFINGCNGV